jgi:glutamate racemase
MIGVFDSGFGGLTILKEFLEVLPQYDYMYLGDNARSPYGSRSHEAVKNFTEEGVKYLFEKGCRLIIIACNTASANVLRELQEEYLRNPGAAVKKAGYDKRKILGVIRPLAEEVARITKTGRVGVVGTRGTINSKSYELELKKIAAASGVASIAAGRAKGLYVYEQACPLLVPLIEEDWGDKPETRMILRKYLRHLKSCNPDTLILGCTHYPFLYKDFCRIMGKNVAIPHPGEVVAKSLKEYLKRHPEIESQLRQKGARHYLTTDIADRFRDIGSRFLGRSLQKVEKVKISN